MSEINASRRNFLKIIGAAGGGLVVGIPLVACSSQKPIPGYTKDSYVHDAFIQISPDNQIHFYVPRTEMGQGVNNGFATLVAEELSTAPDLIQCHHAPVAKAYRNPDYGVQATGGSNSMRVHYRQIRQSAADARAAVLGAASEQLKIPVSEMHLENGQVIASGKAYPMGSFVELASQRPVPSDTPVKDPADFLYIGKDLPRIDARTKSNGTAQFGLDMDFPGLKRAVLQRCPVAGGRVRSFSDTAANAMPGVVVIVEVDAGVAVVADSYWQARQAAGKLEIEWDLPELANFSSDGFKSQLQHALDTEEGEKAYRQGDGNGPLQNADQVITAEYWAPYLAHAAMEPLNCTVKIEGDYCDVWVGSQVPQVAQGLAALHTGIDRDNVRVHVAYLGGGFGRRLYSDYVVQAAQIARASGQPVQLVWSREEDIQHDWFRPASLARFAATVDSDGRFETYSVRRAGPNKQPYELSEAIPGLAPEIVPDGFSRWIAGTSHSVYENWIVDHSSVEGLYEDYEAPNKEVRHVTVDPGLRVGSWRSVGHSFSGFFKESFVDEVAYRSGLDPVDFRLKNTEDNPRLNQVIRTAAEKANWGTAMTPGSSQGIAAHTSFQSRVAQVAEVTVENGEIRVHRVTCVVDCGLAVNPDIVRAQMESAIVFGLTAALYGNIDIVDGVVRQSNFHDYPMLRMDQVPAIEVHIIASEEDPTGVGEPGLPPIAAAVANAIYAGTGQRLRSLPLKPA